MWTLRQSAGRGSGEDEGRRARHWSPGSPPPAPGRRCASWHPTRHPAGSGKWSSAPAAGWSAAHSYHQGQAERPAAWLCEALGTPHRQLGAKGGELAEAAAEGEGNGTPVFCRPDSARTSAHVRVSVWCTGYRVFPTRRHTPSVPENTGP